jgi:hypothetical protein
MSAQRRLQPSGERKKLPFDLCLGASNVRASGSYSPRNKAEDMTAPPTSAAPKLALDQRATFDLTVGFTPHAV